MPLSASLWPAVVAVASALQYKRILSGNEASESQHLQVSFGATGTSAPHRVAHSCRYFGPKTRRRTNRSTGFTFPTTTS
ncbi:MAG: hypothetical protein MZV70_22780 [Desulfobacterales bacterium]|nr:hypothetical protein [Desulfobacterales bacterium]